MKLLGIGNEQWGPQYFERYELFAEALKEQHPEIELVSASGPSPADERFQYAWPRLRASSKADIVDEHCYAMPDWFLESATRYDDYDRARPQSVHGRVRRPKRRHRLAGQSQQPATAPWPRRRSSPALERNSDVVRDVVLRPAAWPRRRLAMAAESDLVRQPHRLRHAQLLRPADVCLHRGDVVLPAERSPTPTACRRRRRCTATTSRDDEGDIAIVVVNAATKPSKRTCGSQGLPRRRVPAGNCALRFEPEDENSIEPPIN